MPDWLREIDHTGDVGIVVNAGSLEALFSRAAQGLFWVICDREAVRPREASPVSVTAEDVNALMVAWLSELNFLHSTGNQLFAAFDVTSLRDDDGTWTLEAVCRGEPIDRSRHTVYTEVKAVTFHGMDVHRTNDGWTVQVIFDM